MPTGTEPKTETDPLKDKKADTGIEPKTETDPLKDKKADTGIEPKTETDPLKDKKADTGIEPKDIKNLVTAHLREFLIEDLFSRRTASDIVSNNAKVVLFGLFAVIGFAVLLYGSVVTNDKFDRWEVSPKYDFWNGTVIVEGKPLNSTQQLEVSQQLEQLNTIFIATISGALALGGTLITQLWGKS